MSTRLSLPRSDDLKEMPLRATVAYAVRCARRVQPLFHLVTDTADFAQHEAAVERAISLAERFCVGDESESRTLAAAANAAADAATAATATAATAAADAARAAAAKGAAARAAAANAADAAAAADDAVADAAARDFETLLSLYRRGWFRRETANNPVDPTEHGPLGPLWPPPTWTPDSGQLVWMA